MCHLYKSALGFIFSGDCILKSLEINKKKKLDTIEKEFCFLLTTIKIQTERLIYENYFIYFDLHA